MKKLLILYSIVLLSAFYLPQSTSAQEKRVAPMMRVSPVILNISLRPGKTYVFPITVDNLLDAPPPLQASLETFNTDDEDGGYSFAAPDTSLSKLVKWSSIDESDFIINPHDRHVMNLTVTIPDRVPIGGYYAMLFFTPHEFSKSKGQNQVGAKVGVLMLASVGIQDPFSARASILDFKPTSWVFNSAPLTFDFRLKNDSLTHFSAKPRLTITSLGGKSETYEVEEKFVFPGKVRHWNISLNEPLTIVPIRKADLVVSTGNGAVVRKSVYIIYWPLAQIIGFSLVFVSVILGIKRRKRIVKAIRILIKGM